MLKMPAWSRRADVFVALTPVVFIATMVIAAIEWGERDETIPKSQFAVEADDSSTDGDPEPTGEVTVIESGFSAEGNDFAVGAIFKNSDPDLYVQVSYEWDVKDEAGEQIPGSQARWRNTRVTVGPGEEQAVGVGGNVIQDFDASEVEDVGVPITNMYWYSEEPDTYVDSDAVDFRLSECGNPGNGKVC
ncbi:hypothetical protein [Salininema proteolyticum]|uniref:DUF5067 domain-containing protein n=1 Tax=Salininema proteolyticum TaxID=1607685 RepID=A0ABV8TW62_9ACTN